MAGSGERHAIIRDEVVREMRQAAKELAEAGMAARDIEQRLLAQRLTPPERAYAKLLALSAEARVLGLGVADALDSELRERERGARFD